MRRVTESPDKFNVSKRNLKVKFYQFNVIVSSRDDIAKNSYMTEPGQWFAGMAITLS